MIGIIFSYANEVVEVRVDNSNVFFRTSNSQQFADITGLRLSKSGVIKEFPDLKDREDWKKIAQDRFKEKIKNLETEESRVEYIIKDLNKFGYVPRYMQKAGFRPVKIK